MSIKLVMPSNHLILCCPLLLLPPIFPSIRVFSNESVLQIRWPKYWMSREKLISIPLPTTDLDSSVLKKFTCKAGDPCTIPEWGRSAEEGIGYPFQYSWASLVAQLVKNLPAMQETWVRSLGWDPLQCSGLENSMDSIIITKSWTRLSDFHFHPQQGGAATAV